MRLRGTDDEAEWVRIAGGGEDGGDVPRFGVAGGEGAVCGVVQDAPHVCPLGHVPAVSVRARTSSRMVLGRASARSVTTLAGRHALVPICAVQ